MPTAPSRRMTLRLTASGVMPRTLAALVRLPVSFLTLYALAVPNIGIPCTEARSFIDNGLMAYSHE